MSGRNRSRLSTERGTSPLPTDTGFDTADVRFRYNVPGSIPDVNVQANLGRGSTSTKGRWIVYVQAAYEGDVAEDNDPDSETGTIGVTASARNSLSFRETIRDFSAEFSADN